ncbi:hypothetical protein B0A49_05390 [Cryomyces minteri]|uniref:DUF7918 domain-containing protein n=1 Tax=Cryomyces minteri TaxID=331657 RepID=A0A4U0X215_9PEZI|nr:hypothetical protein B0A49_05390 [Cryomyces minteri]
MPCFKGLAVSIHTPDGPLPEHSVQRQIKFSRITSYIPVPPAKVPSGSLTNKPEQSTFAISITLLTPNLQVPYSKPKPTPENPYPQAVFVGGLPGSTGERGKYTSPVAPYTPLTNSPNETIAAYIYFDGRAKEEVATLLRKGEETWVNSRWVSVPQSEGGGLAEREFLFREVGLERWLNGLDLEGKDAAAKTQRRRERLDRKRRKKKEEQSDSEGSVEDVKFKSVDRNGVLRYGDNKSAPVESLSGDDEMFSSDSDSDDEPPEPEAAGQIKVALFRVVASGEVKRGEYSPQFDAHDDDDAANGQSGNGNDDSGDADVDHTTSFAQPKTLDPKTISTQTVTGMDSADKPYAVFTFFYRGEKQLRKMGIIPTADSKQPTPSSAKRKSTITDFTKLGPLSTAGTVGFAGYRDPSAKTPQIFKGKEQGAVDSDAEYDIDIDQAPGRTDDTDVKQDNDGLLSPEDAARQGELSEGVRKIKLKRQHSAEPLNGASPTARKSPNLNASDSSTNATPTSASSSTAIAPTPSGGVSASLPSDAPSEAFVGSPYKKQRASMPGLDDALKQDLDRLLSRSTSAGQEGVPPVPAIPHEQTELAENPWPVSKTKQEDEDEEL